MINTIRFSLFFLLLLNICFAEERILNFHSDILVHEDGSMLVSEKIKIISEGDRIKRGIYRDFPTEYKDRFGNMIKTSFRVREALRDEKKEPYRIEKRANGYRVYIGEKDVYLSSGIYTYTLRYKTNFQLGYFENHDELYWNVTGNGWVFSIEKASAQVRLPVFLDQKQLQLEAYTGYQGARGKNYQIEQDGTGRPMFSTTSPLMSEQGLTIVYGFPKGIVEEPGRFAKLQRFMDNNRHYTVLCFAVLFNLIVGFLIWLKVGRDPPRDVVYVQYFPPQSIQADELAYVSDMKYHPRHFAGLLIALAVKGAISISRVEKAFTINYESNNDKLSKKEQQVIGELFKYEKQVLFSRANSRVFSKAMKLHQKFLKEKYIPEYFSQNLIYSYLLFIPMCMALIYFWLSSYQVVQIKIVTIIIVSLLFAFVDWIFKMLIKAPTVKGRRLLDDIEGFIEYLKIAEEDEFRYLDRPRMSVKIFENYMPYAVAFDLEQEWAEKFRNSVTGLAVKDADYKPTWYASDDSNDFLKHGLSVAGFGAVLTATIAASSVSPGSSSGSSSSGGSSGGGGGGGGGGGW